MRKKGAAAAIVCGAAVLLSAAVIPAAASAIGAAATIGGGVKAEYRMDLSLMKDAGQPELYAVRDINDCFGRDVVSSAYRAESYAQWRTTRASISISDLIGRLGAAARDDFELFVSTGAAPAKQFSEGVTAITEASIHVASLADGGIRIDGATALRGGYFTVMVMPDSGSEPVIDKSGFYSAGDSLFSGDFFWEIGGLDYGSINIAFDDREASVFSDIRCRDGSLDVGTDKGDGRAIMSLCDGVSFNRARVEFEGVGGNVGSLSVNFSELYPSSAGKSYVDVRFDEDQSFLALVSDGRVRITSLSLIEEARE